MVQFNNPTLNREIRDVCQAIHRRYADSMVTVPAEPGEHGGFNVVYMVTRDKKQVVEVTYKTGEASWEIAIQTGKPFFSMAALSDGRNVEYQLDPIGTMRGLLKETKASRLWEGDPRIDG